DAARRRRFTELYAEFAADDRGGFGPLKSILAESSGDRQAARVAMARRKAAAAAALAAAGQWDEVWPLLRDASDPTVRTYLIDRLAEGSIDTRILVVKLDPEQEPHAAARRAVLLILGALTSDDLTPADREKLLPDVSLLLDDPDPGVSAAARWVLAQ